MYSSRSYIICSLVLVSLTFLCGSVAAAKKSTRIVGGRVITIDKAPYLVQLRDAEGGVICGGSLVTPQHVVTAAHCVDGSELDNVLVVGGVSTMSQKAVAHEVERITIHPKWDAKNIHFDMAVLKLAQPMSSKNIQTIPIAQKPIKEGDMIQVSGWGLTVEAEGEEMSQELRTVRIPVASRKDCFKEFYDLPGAGMFCASGSEPKGFCMGDSGGPGISKGRLTGVVSFLSACGTVGHHSVFTDVYESRSFIKRALKN